MVAIKTLLIVLMMVVPLFACDCQVSVSQKLTLGKSSKTNTYSVTIQNVGTAAAANVILDADNTLSSVSGMSQDDSSGDSTLYLPKSVQKKGGIPAGSYYQFTYTIKVGQSANFDATCVDAGSSVTSSPVSTDAPTTAPATNAPTSKATSSPQTTAPTTAPTQAASKTVAPTTAPTQAASKTVAPTTAKTVAPTTAPTQAATSKPSKTAAPTTAATSKSSATVAPTIKGATNSPSTSGSLTYQRCSTGQWWQPQPATTWQWQIQGTVDQSINVQVYDIDLFAATNDLIDQLHGAGRHVICYFSTQYENWRPDAAQFPASVIGNKLDDWAGENYVNSNSPIVRQIMVARLQMAAAKGCDAVEPDNVDSYAANNGFSLTTADGLDYNMFFSTNSHALGLSVGLKNDLAQVKSLVNYFDWALNEQCNQYSECSSLTPFITANKAVFNAEYSGSSTTVCPKMITAKISSIFKTLDLTAEIKAQCCTLTGCNPAPYTCGGALSKRIDGADDGLVLEDYEYEETEFNTEALTQDFVQEEAAANSAATAFISASVLAAAVFVALL